MVDQFLIGNMRNFVYLITDGGQSLVVDPQPDLAPWEKRMAEFGSKLVGVLLTHTHHDHVGGVPTIARKYGVPVYVHKDDAHRLKDQVQFVSDGDRVPVGPSSIEVLHTPGHSAGECCYLFMESGRPVLFTGDTIFVGDVGRTDLATGSTEELFHTLQRIKKLPPETVFYPGHDYGRTRTTTLARECQESAAFRCRTTEELDALP